MTLGNDGRNGAFTGEMGALNLDVPEFSGDFSAMSYAQLAEAKQLVESSVDHLFSLLHNTYQFDMTSPLVIEGFPRNDVDVVTVRLIRSKIIRLRNDYSTILEHLQSHLTQQLSANPNSSSSTKEQDSTSTLSTYKSLNIHSEAFAYVKAVVARSPAEKAGLLVGDRIVCFDGDIDIRNHNNLTGVALRVKMKKDTKIVVDVLRNSNRKTLTLVPTENWAGNGLLGCHIVPI